MPLMIPSSSSKLSSWTRSKVAFAMLETLHRKSMVFLLSVSRDHVQIHRSIDNTWGPKQWIWFHLSLHRLPPGFVTSCSLCFQGHFGQRLVPWHGCSHGWIPNVSVAGYRFEGRAAEIGLEIMAVLTGRYKNLHWLYQAWSAIICKT